MEGILFWEDREGILFWEDSLLNGRYFILRRKAA